MYRKEFTPVREPEVSVLPEGPRAGSQGWCCGQESGIPPAPWHLSKGSRAAPASWGGEIQSPLQQGAGDGEADPASVHNRVRISGLQSQGMGRAAQMDPAPVHTPGSMESTVRE